MKQILATLVLTMSTAFASAGEIEDTLDAAMRAIRANNPELTVSLLTDLETTSTWQLNKKTLLLHTAASSFYADVEYVKMVMAFDLMTSHGRYLIRARSNEAGMRQAAYRIRGTQMVRKMKTARREDGFDSAVTWLRANRSRISPTSRKAIDLVESLDGPTTTVAQYDNIMHVRHWTLPDSFAYSRMLAAVAAVPLDADWIGTNSAVLQDIAEQAMIAQDRVRFDAAVDKLSLTDRFAAADYLNIRALYKDGKFPECIAAAIDYYQNSEKPLRHQHRLWAIIYGFQAARKSGDAEAALYFATEAETNWPGNKKSWELRFYLR